jgi:hypothetical protein
LREYLKTPLETPYWVNWMQTPNQNPNTGNQTQEVTMFFDTNGKRVEVPKETPYVMVKAKKVRDYYDVSIYLMPQGKRLFTMYSTLIGAEEWGSAFAIGMNPPEWAIREAEKYNGATVLNEFERDKILRFMVRAGYRCTDVGGSSPDFKDSVDIQHNDGLSFTYVKHSGPNVTVYNYVCLQNGQNAIVHSKGYVYRGDDLGCHVVWDETIEYRNVDGEIVSNRVAGGSSIDCPGVSHRIEHIPPTKQSDVRDLYPL